MALPRWIVFLSSMLGMGMAFGAAQAQNVVSIQKSIDHLDFLVDKTLVTRYHFGSNYSKPIFWPVLAPNGASLTRSWPMVKDITGESHDHVHQKSAWFCHGDVIPEGIKLPNKINGVAGVDFWSEAKGHGSIVCVKVEEPTSKDGHAQVATQNEWRMADGTKIMEEARVIRFHDYGKARLVTFDIDLYASVCPITFGDTKEGSMGIRINDQIRAEKGKGTLQNAEGKKGEKECWGRRSAWTDYSGPIDGKVAGLSILDDPRNAYPSCWHIRGYGLNAANPFGRAKSGFPDERGKNDLVRLAKGEHLKLRSGLVLHDGDTATGGVAEVYRRFVDLRGRE
jgi:hypothetical protein